MAAKPNEEMIDGKTVIANKAMEAYREQYKQLVENLRVDHLKDISDALNAEGYALRDDLLIRDVKSSLQNVLLNALENSWEALDMGPKIAALQMLKKEFKDHDTSMWRPSGKTPEEQTLPIRVRYLELKKSYLQKQIEFQTKKMNELRVTNQSYRDLVEHTKYQRGFISEKINSRAEELEKLKAEYRQYIAMLLESDD